MYLAVGAIVKNERPYLAEWIGFHRTQGVDHFFFVENDSTDGTYEYLLQLQSKGLVTVEQMTGAPVQFRAYNHILKKHGHKTKWLAFTDCDEFLFSPVGNLQQILKGYEKYSAVTARWLMFGSNGHEKKTEDLVIERFTKRAAIPDKHIKSIVQPKQTYKVGDDPHTFRTRGKVADEHGFIMPKQYAITHERKTADILALAHFHNKSKEEAYKRWTENICPSSNKYRDFNICFPAFDLNEVEDLRLAAFADQVKKEIASWKL